jgi:membrane protein implicated in regulation of membrane protease activity
MARQSGIKRRPRLWLILAAPSTLLAVLFAARAAYLFAAILAVLAVALIMRAWEERNPPDG